MFKGVIYKYTNIINGKCYIGETVRELIRHRRHLNAANEENPRQRIHKAFKKYGLDNFTYEILERIECSSKEELKKLLHEREIYYIAKFNSFSSNGYNDTLGGNTLSNKGYKHTYEAKAKISNGNIGNKKFLGKTHTQETKDKISKANSGRKISDEGYNNMCKAAKARIGIKLTEEHKLKIGLAGCKPIIQCYLEDVQIAEHNSIKEAADSMGKHPGSIKGCLSGSQK